MKLALVMAFLLLGFVLFVAYFVESYTLFGVLAIPAVTFLFTVLGRSTSAGGRAALARVGCTIALFVCALSLARSLAMECNDNLLIAIGAIFLGFAVYSAAMMITATHAADPHLRRYGIALGVTAPILFLLAHAFAGFTPDKWKDELKMSMNLFVAYQRSYAALHKTVDRLTASEIRGRWFMMPARQKRQFVATERIATADLDIVYSPDARNFTLFATPHSRHPYRPFNLLAAWPSYRADGNGDVRRCSVRTAGARCAADALLLKRVGTLQQEIARGGVDIGTATRLLDDMDAHDVGDALLLALRLTDSDLRIEAAAQLAKRHDTRAIEPLLTMLHDRLPGRSQIVVALGNFPIQSVEEQLIATLVIATLEDPTEDIETRAFAASTLGNFSGERVGTTLLAALQSGEGRIVSSAASGLAKRHDLRAVDPLLKLLGHPEPAVRASVAGALTQFDDRRIVPALESAAAHDPDAWFRSNAANDVKLLKERLANGKP